uniref:Histone acetyltransferase n=1 Tax=Soboliphyme baturini TaxID=241478 RepID=A0A183J8M9_9BILA
LRRKRKSDAVASSPSKHPSPGGSAGLLEIKDAKDRAIKHCEKFLCRDVTPVCVLKACDKCCGKGYSSKWHHISIGEHYCNFCYEFYMCVSVFIFRSTLSHILTDHLLHAAVRYSIPLVSWTPSKAHTTKAVIFNSCDTKIKLFPFSRYSHITLLAFPDPERRRKFYYQ